jgi:hypothetical protein
MTTIMMKNEHNENIIRFLRDNVEPLDDSIYGLSYRASAYMTDGIHLPCVIFRNPKSTVNLALRRFREEQKGKGIFGKSAASYFKIVEHFITSGNRINDYDIDKVEKSKYAFPISILNQIRGETTMGWTGFVTKMKDGKHLSFGTRFSTEFFQIPENYSNEDIIEIINHSYLLKNGEIRSYRVPFSNWPTDFEKELILRERPYFVCYIENL